MGTAVRVEQHRHRPVGLGAAGREERHPEVPRTADEERRGREEHGCLRGRGDRADAIAVDEHVGRGQAGHRGRGEHGDVRADHGRVDTRLLGETGQRTGRVDAPHVRLGWILVRAEDHGVTDIEDLRHLQADGGHRLVVERQALGVVAIEGADQAAVGEPRGDPDGDVEPSVVVILADEVGLPRVRIDPQDLHRALIARLHQQGQRALRVPHDVHEVGEGLAIPRDVDASAVEVDDRERDDGVVGARARVANRTRRRLRIDRRGDVPDPHGTFVDASGRQSRPVGGPPVAALTLHLFGGDELRETPGHVGVGIRRELSIVRAVHVHDTEGASRDVRDVPSGWIGPRIERVLDVDVQRTRASVHEVGDVQTAVHRERRDRARAVGGVVGDPGQ